MAETKKTAPEQEMVEVWIERAQGPHDEPNFFLGFNGKNWVFPKGKKATVPKYIADEIERLKKAEIKYDEIVAEMKGVKEAK